MAGRCAWRRFNDFAEAKNGSFYLSTQNPNQPHLLEGINEGQEILYKV